MLNSIFCRFFMKKSYSDIDLFFNDLSVLIGSEGLEKQLEQLKQYESEQRTDAITLEFSCIDLTLLGPLEVASAICGLERLKNKQL